MKKLLLLPVLLLSLHAVAQNNDLVQFVNPASVSTPKGYSHAAVVDLGTCKMIIIAGQVALDKAGNLVGPGNLGVQTDQVFRNIKNIVEELGGNMNNIVKLSFFTTDVSKITDIRDARDRYINTKARPASTLVQVSRLFREDLLIEVEATAIIPKDNTKK
ncbi:RidA family protein [Chitinophaga pendula]|uniref:RidA family protein n=1 Tax=Chitinophaga TaxID=79328 RepID=UPI0018DF0688|nr:MULTISPECIES: RidA family protein [Chitinophaga]UCJ09373.1 RidA family protein [Chitinophaga pendula]